jgi:glycerophosphoryl diester phosphodiesterase
VIKFIFTIIVLTLTTIHPTYANSIDIYAHRGYRAIAPENTLIAYQDALKIGVDVIDADVQLSKDHVLVVTHDLTLNKAITKDSKGQWIRDSKPIKTMTLKEIQSYDVGSVKKNSSIAAMYPHRLNIPHVHIPTLKAVLLYLKSIPNSQARLQIELKTDPTQAAISSTPMAIAKALNQCLVETEMVKRVEVQAFEWQALIDLHRLNPAIKTAYLTAHTTEAMNAQQAKLNHYDPKWTAPLKPQDFDFNYPRMIAQLHGTFWEPYEGDLSKATLDQAHTLGLKVVSWGWTEYEKTDFNYNIINQLMHWGIDGIITDRPDILRGLEAAQGFSPPPAYPNAPTPLKGTA